MIARRRGSAPAPAMPPAPLPSCADLARHPPALHACVQRLESAAVAASLEPASIKFATSAPGFDHTALVEGDARNRTERGSKP